MPGLEAKLARASAAFPSQTPAGVGSSIPYRRST